MPPARAASILPRASANQVSSSA